MLSPRHKFIAIGIIVCIGIAAAAVSTFSVWGSRRPRAIEKSRQTEAIVALKDLHTEFSKFYKSDKNMNRAIRHIKRNFIGKKKKFPGPKNCRPSHFFCYSIAKMSGSKVLIAATRCLRGGKERQGKEAYDIKLISDCNTGKFTLENSFTSSTKVPDVVRK